MKITPETYQKILGLAKEYGVNENIRVFSRDENTHDFLIVLQEKTSSIQQGSFEEEVNLLFQETGEHIFTVTEKGLEASVSKYKITPEEKNLILQNAQPLQNFVIEKSLIQSPPNQLTSQTTKPVIFSSSQDNTSTLSKKQDSPIQQKAEEISQEIDSFLLSAPEENPAELFEAITKKLELLKQKYVNPISRNSKGITSH